jgi:hypothetical protein
MQIKTWHVVLFLTVTSCALVIAEIPRDTWLTSAALSLALGVAAVAMMGAAALLGSRWKIIESLFRWARSRLPDAQMAGDLGAGFCVLSFRVQGRSEGVGHRLDHRTAPVLHAPGATTEFCRPDADRHAGIEQKDPLQRLALVAQVVRAFVSDRHPALAELQIAHRDRQSRRDMAGHTIGTGRSSRRLQAAALSVSG